MLESNRWARSVGAVSKALLRLSTEDAPRPQFLAEAGQAVLEAVDVDEVDVCLSSRGRFTCVGAVRAESGTDRSALAHRSALASATCDGSCNGNCPAVKEGALSCVRPALAGSGTEVIASSGAAKLCCRARSAVLSPFHVDDETAGVLALTSRQEGHFESASPEFFATLGDLLGASLASHAHARSIRARANEAEVLHRIARSVSYSEATLEQTLGRVARILPRACLEPSAAAARIVVGDIEVRSRRALGGEPLVRDIVLCGKVRGRIELHVENLGRTPEDEHESASAMRVLGAVARQIATLLYRFELREEKEGSRRLLRHADRLATIGTLASSLVHDLSEPLHTVSGFAELLRKDSALTERARTDATRILAASGHAQDIVKCLMLLARRSSSGWHTIVLNPVVQNALSFVETHCRERNVNLVRAFAPLLPPIVADATLICQVVVNLARNAIQAMPEGGTLTVETRPLDDGVMLSVTDTGVGISEEVKRRMFDAFFTTREDTDGTGLGLAIVQDIVLLHGGQIEVESAPLNGTRVSVRLPRSPGHLGRKAMELEHGWA